MSNLRTWRRLLEETMWNQRYILIDPQGVDRSPAPDTPLQTIFSAMHIQHFGDCLQKGWVLASVSRNPPELRMHIGQTSPPSAVHKCLADLASVGVQSTDYINIATPHKSEKVKLADVKAWLQASAQPTKIARKRRSLAQRVADDQASIIDDDVAGTKFERIVWEREKVIECSELEQVGFTNVQGVYGTHVGDPDFWFTQIVNDYGRDADAWVIEIIGRAGDVLVDDVQYAIPPDSGEKGFSGVLFTSRKHLVEGKDFVFTRHLTSNDLDSA